MPELLADYRYARAGTANNRVVEYTRGSSTTSYPKAGVTVARGARVPGSTS
jgi:hypothetical protein